MTQFADLHTHTSLCRHASGTPEEYLKTALDQHLRYFGVSDHFPSPCGYDTAARMSLADLPQYVQIVRDLQQRAEGTGTQVLLGAEFDYVPGRMDEVMGDLKRLEADYLLGSIHFADGFAFDDPGKIDQWYKLGIDRIWERYAELMMEFVSGYEFNVMSHPDLPKKFALYHSDVRKFLGMMGDVFHTAAAKGICLELNTSGLRYAVKEIYPSPAILKLAKEAGMNVTFGSDSHKPEHVGYEFQTAMELAKSAGFRSAFAFVKGTPVELPFD